MNTSVRKNNSRIALAGAVALTSILTATSAMATEGYFQHGIGAVSKGMGGTGAAFTQDAMGQALNPAGAVNVGNQATFGATLFAPLRSFEAVGGTGPGVLGNGALDSDENIHGMPSLGINYKFSEDAALGLAVIGNGGMNTTWRADIPCTMGMPGIFCTGDAGVDLAQMLIQATYSRRLNDNFSFGVAPIFAVQRFAAKGIAPFAMMSADPANVSNRGYAYSMGYGGRAGFQAHMDKFSLGGSFQSRIYMSEFDEYAGLFAEQGDFDIPANVQIGLAFDVNEKLKLLADYRRIFYSDVASIGNKLTMPGPGTMLGDNNGSGFGWNDTDTIKLGFQYQVNDRLAVRGGYSYTMQPIEPTQVLFNVLAPAVIEHHITGGLTYDINESFSLSLSGMVAPVSSVKGINAMDWGQTIELEMYQFDVSAGLTWRF